jgi:sigma-B regulation protein RsbU (phosphoserine phosphatase)
MTRAAAAYVLLTVILTCALWVRGENAWQRIQVLQNPAAAPEVPVPIQVASRTIRSGLFRGNQILAIDGKPLSSYSQFERAIAAKGVGQTLSLTMSEPSGLAVEKSVRVPSQAADLATPARILIAVCTSLLIPFIALGLGAFVVALRPTDGNAWLVLLLMTAFAETIGGRHLVQPTAALIWTTAWSSQWPLFMMLFGIYFPERLPYDGRHPLIKYVLLVPLAVLNLAGAAILILWFADLNQTVPWRPVFYRLYLLQVAAGMLAIGAFFAFIGMKTATATSPDTRRRLRILQFGSSISMAPMFLVVLRGVLRGGDIFGGLGWPVVCMVLLFFCLFPLALAYVIVVERAMDLRFVVRQSVRYGFARVGLWIARAALIGAAIYMFNRAGAEKRGMASQSIGFAAVGVGLLVLRRRAADGASQWLDRQFFREAYDAERVLTGLAAEAGRFFEIDPLLDKVTHRISDTLHVPDIVVLIREGEYFVPRYSSRPGEQMSIPVDSRVAQILRDTREAQPVYFDKPPAWLRTLNATELQTLDFMRTQLLLPIFGKSGLAGMLSLGPKRSEVPYSPTDIRLLQAVASQMALALENARLAASLAAEAADRERANRELEIAREVQERLFPQNFPALPGLDCAGYCRPARGVGGDYYDFLKLEDGRLGIAIGDVSGKGIAAALLMASLQASLRGQTMAGLHDLSALMRNVNRLVYEASTSNRYATFFYGEYETTGRKLVFVNAGHNAPVILRGAEVLRLEAGGPVVGLLPGAGYTHDEILLQPGDIFIGFTDGISEALNEKDEEWEEERFIASSTACRELSAKRMIEHIFRDADAFTGTAKQYDDMTLLVVKLAPIHTRVNPRVNPADSNAGKSLLARLQ